MLLFTIFDDYDKHAIFTSKYDNYGATCSLFAILKVLIPFDLEYAQRRQQRSVDFDKNTREEECRF